MSLIKEYFNLTKKYINQYGNNTILLMQVGSFFEVYGLKNDNFIEGSQLYDFSRICELNISEKNVCVSSDFKIVMMAGFKDIMIEKYLKKLQNAGFTVVVYVQDQPSKNTTRSCAGIYSPGTYFSNDTSVLSNNLSTIWIDVIENNSIMKGKYIIMGISNINIITGKTHILQIEQPYFNNPTTYDDLERFISIYQPSETILISNIDNNFLESIISFINLNSIKIHKINLNDVNHIQSKKALNCENQIYQKEVINRFYGDNYFDIFSQDYNSITHANQSFCFLLDFVYQHNPHLIKNVAYPKLENNSENLYLANHSLKQLNILDDNNYKGKFSSISSMLNECNTPMGKREFYRLITSPTKNIDYLNKEYEITDYLLNNMEKDKFDEIKSKLSYIKDLSRYERSMFLKKITPKSVYNLYNNLTIIKEIYLLIENDKYITSYLIFKNSNLLKIQSLCDELQSYILKNINLELAKSCDNISGFEINFIKEGINHDLDNKTIELKTNECLLEEIRKYLNKLIPEKSKTTDFVKIHETEKNNFALICTSRRCKLLESVLTDKENIVEFKLLNRDDSIIRFDLSKNNLEYKHQSASNNIITNNHIKSICYKITSIKTGLKDDISFVYNDIINNMQSFQSTLEDITEFVTLIDIIHTKACIAYKYNYCRPILELKSKSYVKIKNLRHPLIEKLQTNELYVGNDVQLGINNKDGILLYGTNAVGKTSFIRSIGISVLLAQSGFFVPCEEFIYSPYQYIFTRIIGNDNLFKGLSTFAVEMSELRTILKLSNENSLILGDELCSGTEIASAVGIFVSGIQSLIQRKSSFIFATHLHEIISFDEIKQLDTLSLKHMQVAYNKEIDSLVYNRKLMDGPGNNMYGLEVCKSLHLDDIFLENAFNIRSKYAGDKSILTLKKSHYNSKKLIGLCENCNKKNATEVHHLQFQKDANKNGIIKKNNMIFHKNDLANLISLCEECHNLFHTNNCKSKRVKSTKGNSIEQII